MAKTAEQISTAYVICGDTLRTCMVDAVLIKDEPARLSAALKCMSNYEKCKADAVKDVAFTKLFDKLKRRLEALQKTSGKS